MRLAALYDILDLDTAENSLSTNPSTFHSAGSVAYVCYMICGYEMIIHEVIKGLRISYIVY
jgi:hypothetical protein